MLVYNYATQTVARQVDIFCGEGLHACIDYWKRKLKYRMEKNAKMLLGQGFFNELVTSIFFKMASYM